MKIIVVSYGDDGHKTHFLNAAQAAGVEAVTFDAGGYPNGVDEVSFDYCAAKPRLSLSIDGIAIDAEEVRGVWWRRPRGALGVNRNLLEQYMRFEGEVVIRSLKEILPHANWVSDPEATRMACRKPVQLMVAKSLSMRIPQTCITNSPEAVKNFIERLAGKKLIMKPAGTSFVELVSPDNPDGASNRAIFTQVVSSELILENLGMVKSCPVIFQEAIEKDSDMRITVVDDEVFCAEIKLEGCTNPNNVDWRNYEGVRKYQRHELPQEIKDQCVKFTHAMGLRFGCIDMGYSRKNGYTFFEINPQGQWLPSEIKLGYPISSALLKALTQ